MDDVPGDADALADAVGDDALLIAVVVAATACQEQAFQLGFGFRFCSGCFLCFVFRQQRPICCKADQKKSVLAQDIRYAL